ncbi:TPA: beta strand repeat-containing protein, partial [Salmonella enterica subsp. enterica serovar Poona]
FGDVEASALNGRGGNWLLDPFDISIVSGSTDTNADEGNNNNGIFTPNGDGSSVGADNIETRLNSGTNVTIKTASSTSGANKSGNITVNADISKTQGGNAGLTLEADGNISITNHYINATTGKLDVNLYAAGSKDGSITLNNASITTNGGNITLGQWVEDSATDTHKLGVSITNHAVLNAAAASNPSASTNGNITLTANNGATLSGTNLTGNNIILNGSACGSSVGLSVGAGSNMTATGNVTVIGSGDRDKGVNLTGVNVSAGNIAVTGTTGSWEAVLLSGSHVNATGNLAVTGCATGTWGQGGVNPTGVKIQSGASLVAGSDLTVTGSAVHGQGLMLKDSTVNGTGQGKVVLTGTAGSQVGVNVSNTTVSAGSGNLTVNGNSASGLGVALNGSHLSGGNVTVNGNVSGGAGAGVSLNSATVSAVSGNITMSGKGKDSSNGSLSVTGNNTFSAENTVLSGEAGRNNKGVVLGNNASSVTNISVTRGNLTVSGMVNRVNAGDSSNIYTGLLASNLNVSVSCGSLNMAGNMAGSYAGDTPVAMNLTNVTLSADNDVTLNGSTVGGGTGAKLNNVTVSATAGNIALNGSVAQGGGTGVSLTSGKMTASSGNVSVTGTSAAGNGVSLNGTTATGNNVTVTGTITSGNGNAGIEVKGDSSLTATNQQGNLTLTGTKTGGGDGYGIHISGGNTLTAGDTITLNGTVMDGKDGALNVDTNTFSAQNTVLSGTSSRNNIGVKAGGNINVTKGNLTVTGVANRINSAPSVSGLMSGVNLKIDVQNGYLNITGNINDTGHNATSANTATGLKLSNTTLKASQDVSLNAEMNGSTDGNAMILSGGNITAGENIALHGTVTEGNGSGVSLSGTGMTAGNGDITVSGNGYDAAKGGLNVNGGNFSAQKTVLTGTAKRNNKGAVLSGNINVMQGNLVVTGTTNQVSGKGWVGLQATGNINVSAGDLSLTGSLTGTDGSGTTALNLTGVNLSAQNMVLNGTNSNSGSGLVLNNATLNATTASLKGSAANSGSGFVLNNITLEGGIAQGSNMTFSSQGSGANVTNTLNVNGGLGYGAFEAMQQAGIDNTTSVGALTASLEDMQKYMNFSKEADWTFSADSLNTSAAAGKAGSWLVTGLTGIDATTNGSISLTGMNLTNSNLSGSSLTLQGGNNASLTLQNTNLTATSGNVSLSANVANGSALVVTGGNITASGDISVNGTTGGAGTAVQVSGGCMTASGNLAVTGTSAAGMGVALNGSQLSGGNVAVMGTTASGNKGMEVKGGSVLTATNAQGNLTLTGTKTGVGNGYGIHIFGGNNLTAGETITLNGTAVDGNDGALNVDTNTFSAQNTVLTGTSSRNNIGVKAGGNINVTKGNLTVTGNMYHRNNGAFTGLLAQSGLNISVSSGNLTLTGQALQHPDVTDGCVSVPSGNVVGLNLTGATLSAEHADLKGVSTLSGSGFILNNVTLNGGIAQGNNMTFSSEGSGANITNTLNVNDGLGYGVFQKIRQAGIDNNTSVLVTADADDLKLMGLNDSNSDWTFNASQVGEAAGGKAGEWGLSFTGIDATTNG